MDVKGAYLNGILKEQVYMKQPEGYTNRMDNICQLIKILYGLKQFGCEWSTQFNKGIEQMGFTQLLSDPCAYIRHQGTDFEIVTVWVDNLLIFSTSDSCMQSTKKEITDHWQVTDLREPSKIIGIEITHGTQSICYEWTSHIVWQLLPGKLPLELLV